MALPSFRKKNKSRSSSGGGSDASIKSLMEVVVVEDSEGIVLTPVEETHPFDPTHKMPFDDVSLLNDLHEGPLLDLLRRRYAEEKNIHGLLRRSNINKPVQNNSGSLQNIRRRMEKCPSRISSRIART